jgi:hypothetical protein
VLQYTSGVPSPGAFQVNIELLKIKRVKSNGQKYRTAGLKIFGLVVEDNMVPDCDAINS